MPTYGKLQGIMQLAGLANWHSVNAHIHGMAIAHNYYCIKLEVVLSTLYRAAQYEQSTQYQTHRCDAY